MAQTFQGKVMTPRGDDCGGYDLRLEPDQIEALIVSNLAKAQEEASKQHPCMRYLYHQLGVADAVVNHCPTPEARARLKAAIDDARRRLM